MICYDKLFRLFKEKKVTSYTLKKDKIISQSTYTLLKQGDSVSTLAIDRLCAYLDCQPGDILEYIPNPPEPKQE